MKKNNNLFSKLLLFLFIFLLPTQLGKHFFFDFSFIDGVRVDYLSLALYLTDIVFFFLLLFNLKRVKKEIFKNRRVLFFLLLLFLFNTLVSYNRIISLYRFVKIVQFYLLYLIFKNYKADRPVVLAFALGGLSELSLALAQLLKKSSLQGIFYFFGERYLNIYHPGVAKAAVYGIEFLRPYGTFSHPNSLAGFFLLLYAFFLTDKRLKNYPGLKTLTLLVFTLLIFISFSKAAILTFLLINLVNFIFQKKTDCRLCQVASLFILLLGGAMFLTVEGDPYSLQGRLALFSNGLSIFKNHLILGVGLGNYLYFQAQFPSQYPFFFLQPVHNMYLLFLAEVGLILTGVVFYFLFKMIGRRLAKFSFLVCFLVVFLTGLVDHYWLTLQQNWLLLPVVFGLLEKS